MTWEESPEEKLARFGVHQLPKGGGNGAGPHRPPFHELANTFPLMDRASPEFRGLVASIKQVGLTEPITLFEGKVLDGRHRLLACEEARAEPRFEDFDDTEQTPLAFVLAKTCIGDI
jgi:hypothetical protein